MLSSAAQAPRTPQQYCPHTESGLRTSLLCGPLKVFPGRSYLGTGSGRPLLCVGLLGTLQGAGRLIEEVLRRAGVRERHGRALLAALWGEKDRGGSVNPGTWGTEGPPTEPLGQRPGHCPVHSHSDTAWPACPGGHQVTHQRHKFPGVSPKSGALVSVMTIDSQEGKAFVCSIY